MTKCVGVTKEMLGKLHKEQKSTCAWSLSCVYSHLSDIVMNTSLCLLTGREDTERVNIVIYVFILSVVLFVE